MEHPVFKNRYHTYFYAALWMVVTIIHFAISIAYYDIPAGAAFLESLNFNFIIAFLSLAIWYVVRFNKVEQSNILSVLINHAATASIIIFIWLLLGSLISSATAGIYFDFSTHFKETLTWRVISGIFYYSIISMIYYLKLYYDTFREQAIHEAELRTLVREAELNALKLQINPHFLFNSLNSVSSLTMSDPGKAQEMVVKLSEYLRYSLSTDQKQKTSIQDELKNMMLYMDIEKVRFGDKLKIEQKIQEECMEMTLPNLVLQPIIENAIKHGVYESTDTVVVEVMAACIDGQLKVRIQNNFDPDATPRKGAGVGLKNVMNRMELIYGVEGLVKTSKSSNQFVVEFVFPQIDESNTKENENESNNN